MSGNKCGWDNYRFFRRLQMISVGIDVSKEKSTICILKPYGEIVSKPFEVCHTEKELSELTSMKCYRK